MHINENADITYEIELELSKKINLYHNFFISVSKTFNDIKPKKFALISFFFTDILLSKSFYIKFKEETKLNCIKMFYVLVRANLSAIFELSRSIIHRRTDSEYECSGIYLTPAMYVFMEFYS